jgi:hypothetical protein
MIKFIFFIALLMPSVARTDHFKIEQNLPRKQVDPTFFNQISNRTDLKVFRLIESGYWTKALETLDDRDRRGLLSAPESFNFAQLLRRVGGRGSEEKARIEMLLRRASARGVLPALYERARYLKENSENPKSGTLVPYLSLLEIAARNGFQPANEALITLEQGGEMTPYQGWVNLQGNPWVPSREGERRPVANRAACAEESKKPARSSYLWIDSFFAGKLAYSLAKSNGDLEPQMAAFSGMRQFQIGVSRLTILLADAILRGDLPLLPEKAISQMEGQKLEVTSNLDLWFKSDPSILLKAFIDPTSGSRGFSNDSHVSCRWVERLSGSVQTDLLRLPARNLQKQWLEAVAREAGNFSNVLVPCETAFHEGLIIPGSRHLLLQIDLNSGGAPFGFSFWYSFFRYFEEAWRKREFSELFPKDLRVPFRTLAVEEMLTWIPAGCQSLTRPECDDSTLSAQTLRSLLQSDGVPDPLKAFPRGPGVSFLEDWEKSKANGVSAPDGWEKLEASDWIRLNLEKWSQARGEVIRRERVARELLEKSEGNLPELEAIQALRRPWSEVTAPLQAYALCGEWILAFHPEWGLLHGDLERALQIFAADAREDPEASRSLKDAWQRFSRLSVSVLRACERWEAAGAWESLDPSGVASLNYSEWYREVLNLGPQKESGSSGALWGQDPWQVLRAELSTWIELRSVSLYRDNWVARDRLLTTNILNPLAAPTACGLYDPGFHRRASWARFLIAASSLGVSAVSGVPLMVLAEQMPGRVHQLEPFLKDGRLRFLPHGRPPALAWQIWISSGVSKDAWCTASLGGAPVSSVPAGALFTGVSVGACKNVKGESLEVESPENWIRVPEGGTTCFTCSVDFVPMIIGRERLGAAGGPALYGNAIVSVIQLIRDLSHPDEIPRRGKINGAALRASFERNGGEIPEECVADWILGRTCARETCAIRWENEFRRLSGHPALATEVREVGSDDSTPGFWGEGEANLITREDAQTSWKVSWIGSCSRPLSVRWEQSQ